jgi:hypothetical protein
MSIYKFLFTIFSLNLFIFLFFKPIGIESTKLNPENVPQIVFKKFTLFNIGSNNVVETAMHGKEGMIFRDGKYQINNINIKYQNSQYIENLKSRYAYYNKGIIKTIGGVLYNRSDGSIIKTNSMSYDIVKKSFFIPKEFLFISPRMRVKGKTLIIDRNTGQIKAFNIDAIFK